MPFTFLKQVLARVTGGPQMETLTWRMSQVVDRGKVGEASLALDRNGRGLMLWENQGELRMMSLRPTDGVAIANFPVGQGRNPVVAVSDKGLGAAFWIEGSGSSIRIMGSPFNVTSLSLHPATVFQGEGQIQHLQAVVDRRGNALVVWCLERPDAWEILAQGFDARKSTWEEQPFLLGRSTEQALAPRLAANRRGRAVVIWEVQESAFEGFLVSHYWPSERTWSDTPVAGVAHVGHDLQVTMDGHGNALAVWTLHPHGQPIRLEASRYRTADSVWEETHLLASGQSLDQVQLRGTEDGSAWIVWRKRESSGPARILARRYMDQVWQERAERVDSEGVLAKECVLGGFESGLPGLLVVQPGAHGDALLYRPWGEQLGAAVPIAMGTQGPISQPHLVMSPKGAIALWRQGEGKGAGLVVAKGV